MEIAIYKTILKSTGRVVYVGQTKKVNDVGTKYYGSGIHKLFNMVYIRDHFISDIITTTEDQNEANYLERYYIEYYCTLEEYGGFNVSHGGLGAMLPGEKNGFYDKHHDDETRQKISETNKRNWEDPEYRQKACETHADFSGENNPFAKKCIFRDKEFGCIKDAQTYAKSIGVSRRKCRNELIIL